MNPDLPDVFIFRAPSNNAELADRIRALLPRGDFRRICIKPNWVLHEQQPAFPIRALITSRRLICATLDACLAAYPNAEWITVGDVPLQSCEFERMLDQCGLKAEISRYEAIPNPRIRFLDLRRERFRLINGFLEHDPSAMGDPLGYREVILDRDSLLDPISTASSRFRVSDYDPGLIASSHRPGFHRYLIAGSALEADLFINLPKMKTHQKAGITGALKNLVGINGQKAYLVHHRQGSPDEGGDEFMPGTPWLIRVQVRMRERLQKRNRAAFAVARAGWRALKRLYGIHTEATRERLHAGQRVYIAAGSWYGNDTIWRMVYDLNAIIVRAPREGGTLRAEPQRAYVAIIDGEVSCEGNGPLQPLPVDSGLFIAGTNPLALDLAMARLMGFDYQKIPCLSHFRELRVPEWNAIDPAGLRIQKDQALILGLNNLAPIKRYVPPPGWRDHIELDAS